MTKGFSDERACTNSQTIPFDGNDCLDNSMGSIFKIGATDPSVGKWFGLTEQDWNCEMWRGGMSNIYGHLHNRDAMHSTKHWPRPVTDDLAAAGRQIFVVTDAVSSRRTESKSVALQRLAAAGVTLVTTEMVLFEWLRRADRPEFRLLRRLIR